jgi:hypothetical protein
MVTLEPGTITQADLSTLIDHYHDRKNSKNLEQFLDKGSGQLSLFSSMGSSQEHIIRIYDRYRRYCEEHKIILNHPDHGYWSIPYTVRGDPQYIQEQKKKINNIKDRWPIDRPAMLITISPRAVGSIYQVHRQIKKVWPKLIERLRKKWGAKHYIWAIEPTKRHYSHYHLVLSGRAPKGTLAQDILHYLQGHGIDIADPGVDVEYCRRDPIKYAMKYVMKGSSDVLWSSMLWLSRGRIWGRSLTLGLGQGGGENNSDGLWTVKGVCRNIWVDELISGILTWGEIGSLDWHLLHDPG